jgi:uncharacterized membrane protein YhaH (DUF805 family)
VSTPYSPYPPSGDQGGYGQPYQPYPQGSGGEPGTPRGYLQGGPVGFGEAISQAFSNILTFNGRASRSAYWWVFLFLVIIAIVVDIIGAVSGIRALNYLADVVVFVVSLALQVRRLHDTDRSGFWWFIGLIPLIGTIVLIVFDCLPGTPGPNKFG